MQENYLLLPPLLPSPCKPMLQVWSCMERLSNLLLLLLQQEDWNQYQQGTKQHMRVSVAIQTLTGGNTNAKHMKKQSSSSEVNDLCVMASEGGHVQKATLSVMIRAHDRETGTCYFIVDEWAVVALFCCWRKLASWQYSCILLPGQICGEEKDQTMLAIAGYYLQLKTVEQIDARAVTLFKHEKIQKALISKSTDCCVLLEFPLGMLSTASTGTRVTPNACRVRCKDFYLWPFV